MTRTIYPEDQIRPESKQLVKLTTGGAVTDSITLAVGSGNQHKAVIQLIRKYQSDLEKFGTLPFKMAVFETGGRGKRSREIAELNEHQATLILTYMNNTESIRKFKIKLITAFYAITEELKQVSDTASNLNNPETLQTLLLFHIEKQIELKRENEKMTTKVIAFNRIAGSEGLNCLRDTASQLHIRPKDLRNYMLEIGWIYPRKGGKGYAAYSPQQRQGLLYHKVYTDHMPDGSEIIRENLKVTPKGLAKLSKMIGHKRSQPYLIVERMIL